MSLQRESLKKYNPFGNKLNKKGNSNYLHLKIQENYLLYIVFPFTTMLKRKQSAHDKGALGNVVQSPYSKSYCQSRYLG